MDTVESCIETLDLDDERTVVTLDVRNLPPPQPLQETLESLADLDEETVLVQVNDRVPQFIFPQLEARGYRFESIEEDDTTVTVIWR